MIEGRKRLGNGKAKKKKNEDRKVGRRDEMN